MQDFYFAQILITFAQISRKCAQFRPNLTKFVQIYSICP